MTLKNGIIAYLPHKYRANARNKKIIFFAIMKPLKGARPTPNKTANQKNTKKGFYHGKQKHSSEWEKQRACIFFIRA
ncbi:type I restriction endonuclease [Helicobacter pylori]|uniref:type I restriction endonuclease n=1 Tax=Helicobacter pylori TaxID=210 RepID=UPI000D3B267D|nr:type I restriction endonuclease [Helicobacter pylori]PUD76539.1 type I restriction endonuclease [Helicobacter pylori]